MSEFNGDRWTVFPWHGLDNKLKQRILEVGCVEQEYGDEGRTRFVFNGTMDDYKAITTARTSNTFDTGVEEPLQLR